MHLEGLKWIKWISSFTDWKQADQCWGSQMSAVSSQQQHHSFLPVATRLCLLKPISFQAEIRNQMYSQPYYKMCFSYMEGCDSWCCLTFSTRIKRNLCAKSLCFPRVRPFVLNTSFIHVTPQVQRHLMQKADGAHRSHLPCNLRRWRFTPCDFDFSQTNMLGSNLCKLKALHFTRKVRICGPPWSLFQGMCVKEKKVR